MRVSWRTIRWVAWGLGAILLVGGREVIHGSITVGEFTAFYAYLLMLISPMRTLGYMLGAAVMVVLYSRLTDPMQLLIAGAVMGFFVNGMLGGYGALISELFPTTARATAQNVLFKKTSVLPDR